MHKRTPFDAGFEFGRRHRNNPIMHGMSWAALGAYSVVRVMHRIFKLAAYGIGIALVIFVAWAVVTDMLNWDWATVSLVVLFVAAALVALAIAAALLRGAIIAAPAAILFAVIGGFCGGGAGAIMGAAIGGAVGLLGLAAFRQG